MQDEMNEHIRMNRLLCVVIFIESILLIIDGICLLVR